MKGKKPARKNKRKREIGKPKIKDKQGKKNKDGQALEGRKRKKVRKKNY